MTLCFSVSRQHRTKNYQTRYHCPPQDPIPPEDKPISEHIGLSRWAIGSLQRCAGQNNFAYLMHESSPQALRKKIKLCPFGCTTMFKLFTYPHYFFEMLQKLFLIFLVCSCCYSCWGKNRTAFCFWPHNAYEKAIEDRETFNTWSVFPNSFAPKKTAISELNTLLKNKSLFICFRVRLSMPEV